MRKLHERDEASLPVAHSGRSAVAPIDDATGGEMLPSTSAPALRFDLADWLPYLEDQDIPEEQKRELIETLWSIVVAFVDVGWKLNSRSEICGEAIDLKAILEAVDVDKGKEAE